MSAPFFPTEDQLLEIIFSELPDGVFAQDRADDPNPEKRSYSSAELRAHAAVVAEIYENLDLVNQDKWASTVTAAGISDWEKDYFRDPQNGAAPLETRRQNLIAKIRAIGGLSLPAISSLIDGILTPKGLAFEVVPWNGCMVGSSSGGWILDETPLGGATYLGFADPLLGAQQDPGVTALDCDLDYAAANLTLQQFEDIMRTAYTYEVRIFGNADAATIAQLERILTEQEPARSQHIIVNNSELPIDPQVFDLGSFVGTKVNQFDGGDFLSPPASFDVYDMGSFT